MTYILSDAPAAQLTYHRIAVTPSSSSPAELLSAALNISNRKARSLFEQVAAGLENPLSALRNCEIEQLTHAGLTEKQAIRTHALIELGRRIYSSSNSDSLPIESPDAAAAYLTYDLAYKPQEHFAVLVMNIKNQVIGKKVIAIGSSTETIASPKEVFQIAVRMGGDRIIVAHNHPSNSTEPSPQDIQITDLLLQAGKALDIEVMDHLILGNGSWNSLRQSTALWNS